MNLSSRPLAAPPVKLNPLLVQILLDIYHKSQEKKGTIETHRQAIGAVVIDRYRQSVFLLHVYQKSTKKASDLLYCKGSEAFHILGRLPDVYQLNFFTPKDCFFLTLS